MQAGLILQTELEQVLALDLAVDESGVQELCQRSTALWLPAEEVDDVAFLVKAALIHSFKETVMPDQRRKWQHVICTDEAGMPMGPAMTWKEFCLSFLHMSDSSASQYKRVWEIYVLRLGYSFQMLRKAGKSKLAMAVKTVVRMLPASDPRLMRALFGDDHMCAECRVTVLFDNDMPPLICPRCDESWESVLPKSFAALLLLLAEMRGETEQETEQEGRFEGDVELFEEGEEISMVRWVGWWMVGTERYPVAWETPVIGEGAIGVGIPLTQVLGFSEGLRRRLK